MNKKFGPGLCNYYGCVEFDEREGKFFMILENYDGENEVEISKEFFEAAKKEFNPPSDKKGFQISEDPTVPEDEIHLVHGDGRRHVVKL